MIRLCVHSDELSATEIAVTGAASWGNNGKWLSMLGSESEDVVSERTERKS